MTTRRLRMGARTAWLLLAAGLGVNEWVLAALASDDGLLAPLTVARVRVAQTVAIGCGLLLLFTRRRLAHPTPFRNLMRESPRAAALLLGLLAAVCLWLCAEVVVGLGESPEAGDRVRVTMADGSVGETVAEPDPALGYRLIPGIDARMQLVAAGGQIKYDIDVVTDAWGRRITPASTDSVRHRYALFFGCSFTWGDAVRGDETLPAAFAREAAAHRPYNYAFRGYGPQQMLVQLRRADMRQQVGESDGIAIYVAIDDHIRRAIGSMRVVTGVRATFPYFRLDARGKLVDGGSFVDGRPYRHVWYDLASSSQVLRRLNVDIPLTVSDSHLELVAAIIDASRRRYEDVFGNDRFHVVLYPGSTLLGRLRPLLEARRIRYLDYRGLFAGESRAMTIEGDGHPTPLAYSLAAARLAQDLGVQR